MEGRQRKDSKKEKNKIGFSFYQVIQLYREKKPEFHHVKEFCKENSPCGWKWGRLG
jgi:hypothetical protein